MSTTDPFQSHPDGSFVVEGVRITAAHFDPPKPTIPQYGWVAPKQPADAIEGAL